MPDVFDGGVFDPGAFDVGVGSPATGTPPRAAARSYLEVCEIDLPGGTVRIAPVSYSSLSRGHFTGKVRSYGSVQMVPSDRDGSQGAMETTVDLADVDRALAQVVEGSQAYQVVGSAARRYLADPAVAFSSWRQIFGGVVTKSPTFKAPFAATVTMRVDDAALERAAPRQGWTIDRTSWPNAHPDALTKTAQRVYGKHSAARYQTHPGFLTGHHVDTINHGYAFAAGRMKTIDTVYVGDVETASGWAMSYEADRRGRIWTLVRFAVDQGDAVITASGEGYDYDGTGAGVLIEDVTDQLAHLLSNFHLGEWKTGPSWLPTSTRLGETLTGPDGIKAFLGLRMPTGAPDYTPRVTGLEVLRDFCDQHGVRSYWGPTGLLEFCAEDVAAEPYTGIDVDWDREVFSFSIEYDDVALATGVRVEHVHSEADGHYLSSFGVAPPDASADEQDQLSLLWSPAA